MSKVEDRVNKYLDKAEKLWEKRNRPGFITSIDVHDFIKLAMMIQREEDAQSIEEILVEMSIDLRRLRDHTESIDRKTR